MTAGAPPMDPNTGIEMQWDTRRPSQVLAIASLVEQGVLSTEVADKAKQSLELHVTAGLDSQLAAAQSQLAEARSQLAEARSQLRCVAQANSAEFEADVREQLPTACKCVVLALPSSILNMEFCWTSARLVEQKFDGCIFVAARVLQRHERLISTDALV